MLPTECKNDQLNNFVEAHWNELTPTSPHTVVTVLNFGYEISYTMCRYLTRKRINKMPGTIFVNVSRGKG